MNSRWAIKQRHRGVYQLAIQPSTESCGYACCACCPEDPCKEQAIKSWSARSPIHVKNDPHTTRYERPRYWKHCPEDRRRRKCREQIQQWSILKWTTQNACGLVQLSWNSYGGHWNAMWARPRLQAATEGHYSTSTLTIDVHTSIILKKIIKEKTTEIQGVSWTHSKI